MAQPLVDLAPTPVRAKPFVPPKPYSPPKHLRAPIKAKAPPPAKPAKEKRPPHEYPHYDTSVAPAFAASPRINPAELYKVLEVAPYVKIDFDTEKQLLRFRHNLYGVNIQGKFRYATRREGWTSLIILRLK